MKGSYANTSEHDDGRFREVESIDEEISHALGVVDAALELVPGIPVRDAADHGLLPPVRRRGGPRRCAPGIGDGGDRLADDASYRFGAGRELQRRAAARAVDQHHLHIHVWIRRGWNCQKGGGGIVKKGGGWN